MTERDVNELKERLMTEQDVRDKYDLWLTKISKYIISRSSKFLSSETQKDGRILLFLSVLSSFSHIGIINLEENNSLGISFSFNNGGAFIPIIMEVVCLYFAFAFFIDAYNELKIWQFKTLIKSSDDENPLRTLEIEKDELKRKGEEISIRYDAIIEKATKEHEVETPSELAPSTNNIDEIREYGRKIDVRIEKQQQLTKLCELHYAAKDIELKQLKDEYEIWNFKMQSFEMEVMPVVKFYKFKRFINFIFPLLVFIISIATLSFYLIRHFKSM